MMNDEVIYIDVRSAEEFADGYFNHAINIPLDLLEGKKNELNKNFKYITLCKTGIRSDFAKNILKQNGFIVTSDNSVKNSELNFSHLN